MDRFDGREALERFIMGGHVMSDEQIPGWAVELTKQVTILNERLPNHIDWTERNIKDHEFRIREIEQSNVKDHETRIRQVEKFIWVAMGASATVGGTVGSLLTKLLN
jgi:uncharacterized protein YktB (UPF0637 family)